MGTIEGQRYGSQKEPQVKSGRFKVLRVVTGTSLVALLAFRIGRVPAPELMHYYYLALVLLWFMPTLIWDKALDKARCAMLRHDAEFAAVDGYLVLVVAAAALDGIWNRPFLLLGGYVFLAGLSGGWQPGAVAMVSTFFGLLNAWLMPIGALRQETLLLGGGTALAAFVCGMAWRFSLPLLAKMLPWTTPGKPPAKEPEQPDMDDRLAAMEARLRDISDARDRAQEQLCEWEKKQPAPAAEPAPPLAPARMEIAVPETDDPELKAQLHKMATMLTDCRAEQAALLAEKQQLLAELADLTKELNAVRASAASANPPETLPQGDTHAHE